MAKSPSGSGSGSESERKEDPFATPPAEAKPAGKGGKYVVKFAGQPSVTIEAASMDEAIKAAAEQLGVVSSEKAPEVIEA